MHEEEEEEEVKSGQRLRTCAPLEEGETRGRSVMRVSEGGQRTCDARLRTMHPPPAHSSPVTPRTPHVMGITLACLSRVHPQRTSIEG